MAKTTDTVKRRYKLWCEKCNDQIVGSTLEYVSRCKCGGYRTRLAPDKRVGPELTAAYLAIDLVRAVDDADPESYASIMACANAYKERGKHLITRHRIRFHVLMYLAHYIDDFRGLNDDETERG